jgi:hypothetical protein
MENPPQQAAELDVEQPAAGRGVYHMLKIWVVSVEQLKLDLVLVTLEKCVLLLLAVLTSSVGYLDS